MVRLSLYKDFVFKVPSVQLPCKFANDTGRRHLHAGINEVVGTLAVSRIDIELRRRMIKSPRLGWNYHRSLSAYYYPDSAEHSQRSVPTMLLFSNTGMNENLFHSISTEIKSSSRNSQ